MCIIPHVVYNSIAAGTNSDVWCAVLIIELQDAYKQALSSGDTSTTTTTTTTTVAVYNESAATNKIEEKQQLQRYHDQHNVIDQVDSSSQLLLSQFDQLQHSTSLLQSSQQKLVKQLMASAHFLFLVSCFLFLVSCFYFRQTLTIHLDVGTE